MEIMKGRGSLKFLPVGMVKNFREAKNINYKQQFKYKLINL